MIILEEFLVKIMDTKLMANAYPIDVLSSIPIVVDAYAIDDKSKFNSIPSAPPEPQSNYLPPQPYCFQSRNINGRNYDLMMEILQLPTYGFNTKLASEFVKSNQSIEKFYFIADDSGSMGLFDDGKVFKNGKWDRCLRRTEMQDVIIPVWNLFNRCNIPCRIYNFSRYIDTREPGTNDDINNLVRTSGGGTPLNTTLSKIYEDSLRINGKKKLIIVTDGESSDGNILRILRKLGNIGFSITIRLCTDDDSIVNYWNNIDKELEFDLDIIDAYPDEYKEVLTHNPTINYSYPLHKFREFGTSDSRFDGLDERRLPSEHTLFFQNLTGEKPYNRKQSIQFGTYHPSWGFSNSTNNQKCIIM